MGSGSISLEERQISSDNDPWHEELNRLFYLYRLSNLNTRYYGRRAAWYESLARWALVAVAAISAVALTVILSTDPKNPNPRIWATVGSGIATVVLAVIPSFGWSERARELRSLHFAYGQLFGQIESVITKLRRAGHLTDESLGMSQVVQDMYLQLHALDEADPKEKIVDEEDKKVREAFPDDYVWTRF